MVFVLIIDSTLLKDIFKDPVLIGKSKSGEKQYTVESGYNDFQGTDDFPSLYPEDALTERSKKNIYINIYIY